MDAHWRVARRISGLAHFEAMQRRKLRRGRVWVFAYRVTGTPEQREYERIWRSAEQIAERLRREGGIAA